jgi:hypothetical protein
MMHAIVRQTLFESDAIAINAFAAHPSSDACGDVGRQNANVVVLPFAGVTNCDVHDGWPPPQVLPLMDQARAPA